MEVAISDRPLSENNVFPLKKFKASVTCENKLLKGHGGSCSSGPLSSLAQRKQC